MSTELIPKLDAIRAHELIELAHHRFSDHLHEAEERVLRDSASSSFPSSPAASCPLPPVRAKFIRWIIGDEEAHTFIDPRGIRVWGAAMAEELSLSDCRIPFPLDFRGCEFAAPLSLVAADTRQVSRRSRQRPAKSYGRRWRSEAVPLIGVHSHERHLSAGRR